MSEDVALGCRCGQIRGRLRGASPRAVNRAVCYCDDCQAFLHHLGRADLLDEHGGTDVVQVAPAAVTFDEGVSHIVGLRLSPRGLYRWYADCCKTPLGNTLRPKVPFIGIGTELFRGAPDARRRDAIFGPPRGRIMGKYAVGGAPEGSTKLNVGLLANTAKCILLWKLGGKAWPHPYFDRATGEPSRPVKTLSRAERDALRPLCGPHPTATAEPGGSNLARGGRAPGPRRPGCLGRRMG
ncbi:MAG TPA: DUF6151 family protein [Polyangiaceae bacterium]|nr:DUF6151 family protein [Polyangiaceae bacterium]